jgi:hypothetical protein
MAGLALWIIMASMPLIVRYASAEGPPWLSEPAGIMNNPEKDFTAIGLSGVAFAILCLGFGFYLIGEATGLFIEKPDPLDRILGKDAGTETGPS